MDVSLIVVERQVLVVARHPGEQRLDAWMADHAKVVWVATEEPWALEDHLIRSFSLPLNLAGNMHPFCKTLSAIRSEAAAQAASAPVVERGGPRRLSAALLRTTG